MTGFAVVVSGLGVPGGAQMPGGGEHVTQAAAAPEPRACEAVTKAGGPCKGTPGDDGFCAAHKPVTP